LAKQDGVGGAAIAIFPYEIKKIEIQRPARSGAWRVTLPDPPLRRMN
jgi:hypothetical protein